MWPLSWGLAWAFIQRIPRSLLVLDARQLLAEPGLSDSFAMGSLLSLKYLTGLMEGLWKRQGHAGHLPR